MSGEESGLVMAARRGGTPIAARRLAANPRRWRADLRESRFAAGTAGLYTSATKRRSRPMAMTMNGQVQLAAKREVVWAKLNDPEVLKSCIPGSEQLDKISDNEFQAIATVKVGPVKARWKGKVRLTDLDPPNSYRISGEGEGGVAGFAKGGAKVSLSVHDGGTLLTYDVEAQIGGKLAQLGQRLINSAAKKTADDFFVKFAAAVTQSA
jgi:carbon monoxide dehydrogenase subunit G